MVVVDDYDGYLLLPLASKNVFKIPLQVSLFELWASLASNGYALVIWDDLGPSFFIQWLKMGQKFRLDTCQNVQWRCYGFHRGNDQVTIRFHGIAIKKVAAPSDHVANAIRVIAIPSEYIANAIRVIAMLSKHVECSSNSIVIHCNTNEFLLYRDR